MTSERTAYLDFIAKCDQAFRPFAPIDLPDFFKGRQESIDVLVRELATPGRHVAIYGERGVGKTSLAKLAYFFAQFDDENTRIVRCESSSTYDTIFGQLLFDAGYDHLPNGRETESESKGSIGAGGFGASRRGVKRVRERAAPAAGRIGPDMLLKVFSTTKGLLIIDEYDRVQDPETHVRLAETLKHFSDAASETKVIVVGVADTLKDLIGQHASLTRCLAQIKLDRMRREELEEIIKTGESRLDAAFEYDVTRRIVALSDGFPYYTHLLCKRSAESAATVLLKDSRASVVIATPEYQYAVEDAIRTSEESLREAYQQAVITVRRKTDMFQWVLWGVAYSENVEVQVQDIADGISLLTGEKHKKESLSNYLGTLSGSGKGRILTRVRQGYYRFTDPLMRAYVRLLMEGNNINLEGQYEFPWMREQ